MELGSDYAYVGCSGEDELIDIGQTLKECFEGAQPTDTETCLLDILDTAGQEEFSLLRDEYMIQGDGFLIIYDITNPQSLKEAETILKWVKVLKNMEKKDLVPAVLCGNKADLTKERQISMKEGQKVADTLMIPFIETSAKSSLNITAAFEMLIRLIPRTSITYKVVILGGGGVGKSSVTLQYVSNTFVESYDPTIEDSYRKKITLSGLPNLSMEKPIKGSTKKDASAPQPMLQPKNKKGSEKKGDTTFTENETRAEGVTARVKRTDTNVICVNLGTLSQEPVIVTGDPHSCKQCEAVLSKVSMDSGNINTVHGSTTWICEFCGHNNHNLEFDDNELPSGESFDFVLLPGSPLTEAAEKVDGSESGMIVYCIDISYSMTVEAKIPKSQVLWRKMRDGLDPDSNEQTWRKSKMDCIKEAVLRQMESLRVSSPNKRVALVTFSTCITMNNCGSELRIGEFDCSLFDREEQLLQEGRRVFETIQFKTVADSISELSETVEGLKGRGHTALGPALTFCVGLVSQLPGSEIILCTDGAPNEGVGVNYFDDYYRDLGITARQNKTVVSILAVEGEKVGLDYVGGVVMSTSGKMNIVNPLEIQREVRLMSQNPVIAMDVSITILLHAALTLSDKTSTSTNSNVLLKEIGIVPKNTDLTFRYALKDRDKPLDISHVPFQVQVKYTLNNGMKYMRIITKRVEATTDMNKSEKALHVSVVGLAAVHSAAWQAEGGHIATARLVLHSAEKLMKRGAVTTAQQEEHFGFVAESQKFEDRLLPECVGTDDYARFVNRGHCSGLSAYQAPSHRESVYAGRSNYNANLRDQYYSYRC